MRLSADQTSKVCFKGRQGAEQRKTDILDDIPKLQWLTRICPPAPAICRRPPTASSWAAGSFLSYFDGAATRAQLAPEEGEEGSLGNEDEGHPAQSVIDGTHSADRCLGRNMESICVSMYWAVTGKDKAEEFVLH